MDVGDHVDVPPIVDTGSRAATKTVLGPGAHHHQNKHGGEAHAKDDDRALQVQPPGSFLPAIVVLPPLLFLLPAHDTREGFHFSVGYSVLAQGNPFLATPLLSFITQQGRGGRKYYLYYTAGIHNKPNGRETAARAANMVREEGGSRLNTARKGSITPSWKPRC